MEIKTQFQYVHSPPSVSKQLTTWICINGGFSCAYVQKGVGLNYVDYTGVHIFKYPV